MKTHSIPIPVDQKLFGAEMHENPYPVYQRLRESDPVHRDEQLQAWVLTRYADVSGVLNDKCFSSNRVTLARHRFPQPELEPLFDTLGQLMLQRDEPDHTRLRSLVNKAFVRTSVESWAPTIQQRVDELIDDLLRKEQVDFIWDFAVPLPLMVIAEIVGIPAEDRQQVKAWCDDFALVATNFYANIRIEQLQRGLQSTLAFREYLRAKVDELKQSPKLDLLTSLVQVHEEGSKLGLDELLANALLLLNAGNETTTNLLGNGLAALLKNPQQLQLLRENPDLCASAVEEFLRFDSPVQFLGRVALEDVTLESKTIRKGDLVLVILAAANRDPEHFVDPDCLDITRENNHHLAFGHGHHFCVGAQLARLEARMAFSGILARLSDIELSTENLVHRENFSLRCFQHLPLRIKR